MKCFVVSPIGEEGSDIRKQADNVLEFVIKDALQPLGYEVERADTIAESGLITTQVIERITSCDLLVADLSRHNANVFYELAIRHVTGKPFIHLIEAGQKIPFDVAASRTIIYTLDLSGAKRAKDELQQQAKSLSSSGARVESPVSIAIDFKALSSRDDPISTALQRIERDLNDIKTAIDRNDRPSALTESVRDWMLRVVPREVLDADAKDPGQFVFGIDGVVQSGWTDKRVELLREMWNSGSSAAEIGKVLGISRNAVIGKVHRLGLENRLDDSDKG